MYTFLSLVTSLNILEVKLGNMAQDIETSHTNYF